MDWEECVKNNIVKDIGVDTNKINSIRKVAYEKIKSANYLPNNHMISKITLLYDALREFLEVKALEKGFKIYNHECYGAFLKEILGKTKEADLFDEIRNIRNGINYYGRQIDEDEFLYIVENLKKLIEQFKK